MKRHKRYFPNDYTVPYKRHSLMMNNSGHFKKQKCCCSDCTWWGRKCTCVTAAFSSCRPMNSTPGAPYLNTGQGQTGFVVDTVLLDILTTSDKDTKGHYHGANSSIPVMTHIKEAQFLILSQSLLILWDNITYLSYYTEAQYTQYKTDTCRMRAWTNSGNNPNNNNPNPAQPGQRAFFSSLVEGDLLNNI